MKASTTTATVYPFSRAPTCPKCRAGVLGISTRYDAGHDVLVRACSGSITGCGFLWAEEPADRARSAKPSKPRTISLADFSAGGATTDDGHANGTHGGEGA
jgi:hypothetical protein